MTHAPTFVQRGARLATLALALAFAAASALAAPGPAAPAAPAAESAKPAAGTWSHAYASYGATPKYPRGFPHFEYVNPDAPKGGTLQLQNPDRRSSFDKFNPYTIKGQSPAGLTTLMLESLAIKSGDEPGTIYGMVAEEMLVAPDKSSVTFRIHPKARFTNGDPVTAEDMRVVFETLTGKGVAPGIRVEARRRRARDGAGRPHDPLRPQGAHRRHDLQRRRACRCSRASGC